MTRHARILTALAVFFTSVLAAAVHAEDKPRTISVSATGMVAAAPDLARVRAGAITENSSARAALDANAEKIRGVLGGLRTAGIDPKDIQTSQFDVRPIYNRPKSGPARIQGYRVINQIQVIVRDVPKLGTLIDRIVSLGANRVDSIRFDVSDFELRKDQARREAMRNAIRRATLYAQAAGASLGEVLQISERAVGPGPSRYQRFGASTATSPAPIAPGQLQLGVTVHVTWALK